MAFSAGQGESVTTSSDAEGIFGALCVYAVEALLIYAAIRNRNGTYSLIATVCAFPLGCFLLLWCAFVGLFAVWSAIHGRFEAQAILAFFAMTGGLYSFKYVAVYAHEARVRDVWRQPPECRTCGYNLTGNRSGICPECGTKIEFALLAGDETND
jgi:uncharacterized integral membrane protein